MEDKETYRLQDLIDRYLMGEMESQEALDFEKRVETEAELSKALLERHQLNETLAEANTWGVESQEVHQPALVDELLSDFDFEEGSAGKKKNRPKLISLWQNNPILISAAAIAIIALFFLLFLPGQKADLSKEEILAQYFTEPFDLETQKSLGQDKSILEKLAALYDQGAYDPGIVYLDSLIAHSAEAGAYHYFKAKFLLAKGDTLTAQTSFEIASKAPIKLKQNSTIDLALTYLHFDQIEIARQALQRIINTDNAQPADKEYAEEILSHIEKLP